jgi:hypothetical protein
MSDASVSAAGAPPAATPGPRPGTAPAALDEGFVQILARTAGEPLDAANAEESVESLRRAPAAETDPGTVSGPPVAPAPIPVALTAPFTSAIRELAARAIDRTRMEVDGRAMTQSPSITPTPGGPVSDAVGSVSSRSAGSGGADDTSPALPGPAQLPRFDADAIGAMRVEPGSNAGAVTNALHAGALVQPPGPVVGPQTAQIHLSVPIDRPEFADAIANRVLWQVGHGVQSAQIHLNPPELGPVEVKVEIQRGDAQVHFLASHAQVRDALESTLPRLREMFADVGLRLGDASVASHGHGDGRAGLPHPDPPPPGYFDFGEFDAEDAVPRKRRVGVGLIDYYV